MLRKPFNLILFTLLVVIVSFTVWHGHSKTRLLRAAPHSQTVLLGGRRIMLSSPVAGDLNGNGRKEIVVGAEDGMLYILSYINDSWTVVWSHQTASDINAALQPPFQPQSIGHIESSPSLGDIDNDGQLEIVITTGGMMDSVNYNGGIIVYELNSPTGSDWEVKSGWPFIMPDTMGAGAAGNVADGIPDGIEGAPTLGDIDGDGDLEIITMAYDRRIRAFHHNGSEVDGWPIQRESGDVILRGGRSSAAIADIDADGKNEIIIGNNSPPWGGDVPPYTPPDYTLATLWALNGDSSLVPNFPLVTQQNIRSSPAIGDIDGDGDLEIVVGTGPFGGYQNGKLVYAWHADGTPVNGWPVSTNNVMSASPALADLDNDGDLDVIINCGELSPCKRLYAWDENGQNISGFPFDTPYDLPFAATVANIDADADLEILLTSWSIQGIIVVQHNGSHGAIDISRTTNSDIRTSAYIDDLDGDGFLETVVGGASRGQAAVYIFDEVSSASSSRPWPATQQNSAHTGYAVLPKLNPVSDVYFLHQKGTPEKIAASNMTVANIGGGTFAWSIDKSNTPTVSVVPLAGTVQGGKSESADFTVDTSSYAVDQWHNLGTVILSAMADGKHVQNSSQTVNVKLYVGDISHTYLPIITK